MRMRWTGWLVLFGMAGIAGFWLARSAVPDTAKSPTPSTPVRRMELANERMPEFRREERPVNVVRDVEAIESGALANERVIVFASREALEAFLSRLGDGAWVLGRIDALNALRLGFDDFALFRSYLDGDEEVSMIFPVEIPLPGGVGAQPGAVPLGNGLLAWLGIDGMAPAGDGVVIAILDTGITAHRAFGGSITSIDLVERLAGIDINGHGTAVASMILGQNALTPGVAPNASIIDVRVANDFGSSNSWLLAQGILAAVDAGAQIISISLGSGNDSALVRNALAVADAAGVLVVAAAGNQGSNQVSYPAANAGVLAVGATDATGNSMAFSNRGSIDMAAPGFGVNAAYPGDNAVIVNGTSFSAPIVAGSLAWIMSTQNVTTAQALQLMQQNLNDAGPAGPDSQSGAGLPALDRVANRNTPGISDMAIASHHISPPSRERPYAQLEVVIQNRGTEPLLNSLVTVQHPGGTTTANIASLQPGAVQPVLVPISNTDYQSGAPLTFDSNVMIRQGTPDANPTNDRRIDVHHPTTAP